jgi:hypothetical protein
MKLEEIYHPIADELRTAEDLLASSVSCGISQLTEVC